jgi:hypothetical protein
LLTGLAVSPHRQSLRRPRGRQSGCGSGGAPRKQSLRRLRGSRFPLRVLVASLLWALRSNRSPTHAVRRRRVAPPAACAVAQAGRRGELWVSSGPYTRSEATRVTYTMRQRLQGKCAQLRNAERAHWSTRSAQGVDRLGHGAHPKRATRACSGGRQRRTALAGARKKTVQRIHFAEPYERFAKATSGPNSELSCCDGDPVYTYDALDRMIVISFFHLCQSRRGRMLDTCGILNCTSLGITLMAASSAAPHHQYRTQSSPPWAACLGSASYGMASTKRFLRVRVACAERSRSTDCTLFAAPTPGACPARDVYLNPGGYATCTFSFLPSAAAALCRVWSVTDSFLGSKSRSRAERLVCMRCASVLLVICCSFIASQSSWAITRLIATASERSSVPSSRRKSSKLEPLCVLFAIASPPVSACDASLPRSGHPSASSVTS